MRVIAPLFALLSSIASSQSFHVVECSLQCSNGAGGSQVFCGVVDIHVDQWLEVRFTDSVDPASLSTSAFRIIDVGNGTAVTGDLYVSLFDPAVVIFRPSRTTFSGTIGFGFSANRSYELRLPGTAQGDSGPFVQSVAGVSNESRVVCTVFTGLGIEGPVVRECDTSPNSVGTGARIDANGFPSVAMGSFELTASGLPPQSFGVYQIAMNEVNTPLGMGTLCIGPQPQNVGVALSDATGASSLPLTVTSGPLAGLIQPGNYWFFQLVYRDRQAGAAVIDASDAIRVLFYP